MIIEKRNFFQGTDGDTSVRLLDQSSSLNLMNCRMGVTEYGRNFRLESIPGTLQVAQSVLPPYGYNQTIGSVFDQEGNRIIEFVYNSFGYDCITATDISDLNNPIRYAVIYSTQITGGLNFSRNSLIHSANVVNGILYFPDSTNNQPRAVQIDAGIKSNQSGYVTDVRPYSFPLNFSEITLIKPPPIFTPNINKYYDAVFNNNFIANESFQFAFMYGYYTNEQTVTGAFSQSSRLNKPAENYNYVKVVMDGLEYIPSTVRYVYLTVRKGQSLFIINTWDRNIVADANEIDAQNAVTAQLTYNFYNNITGIALAPNLIVKQADYVPYYAETNEVAKNRNILGNITLGDPTPATTSLDITLTTGNLTTTTLLKQLVDLRHRNGRGGGEAYAYVGWYVYLTEVVPVGWYAITSTEQLNSLNGTYPTLGAAPPSVAFSGLTFRGSNLTEVALATAKPGTTRWDGPFLAYSSSILTITGLTVTTFDVFKNKSQVQAAIQFYDFAMRPIGGVVTDDDLLISIPQRSYSYGTGTTGMVWNLTNTDAINEIPENAYYYAIMLTNNLKTRFFIESFNNSAKYATKNNDGQYVFTNTTFVTAAVGIAIDTTPLIKSGLGYTFTEGDICVLIKSDNTTYELPVIGQDGNFIIIKAQDIGDLTGANFVYEIYTPYAPIKQEPFFNRGEVYRILYPETYSRQYDILTDTINPDCYAITRNYNSTTYIAEAMSPNDLYYQQWDTDAGKSSVIADTSRVTRSGDGCFSNVYIPGTNTNGLSTFEPLNTFSLPQETGALCKLILSDKVEDDGNVLLAIARNNICSIYLGEVQVVDATGESQYFVQSTGFIGSINTLKQAFGSVNPESVIQYKSLVFGVDVNNGIVWQYSGAGLEDVSRYKQTRFFKRYCLDYLQSSKGNLDNINGFHHIRTCIDPFHKELVVSLPGLIYENYAETLPSYTSVPSYASSIINRFDIYDKLAKSMIFKYEDNIWGNNQEYGAEWYEYAGDVMYGWKNGLMSIHNADTTNWNTFYGVQRPLRACFTGNMNPSALKDLYSIAIEGSQVPDFTVAMTNVPDEQITDLSGVATADKPYGDYNNQQSILYANFFRDRLDPNQSGAPDEKLYKGALLTDFSIFVMAEFQAFTELMYIEKVNIGYEVSKGQKRIAEQ
jgi:hypothetical protein